MGFGEANLGHQNSCHRKVRSKLPASFLQSCIIRASVDALCRDGTSEISRDPRTKRLETRLERLVRFSKHTSNISEISSLVIHKLSLAHTCLQFSTRESAYTRFHDFRVIIFFIIIIIIIIIIIFFSKPAISLPEQASALIF